ncbi:hypothetical protein O3M35_009546 [Rhynocoris fuscipes]|uniref:Uncharacterized protein n=1 Tax=Rhynocoris fuscipes TaxID=488301 RepID=A0AAW1D5M3_9HEMI
MVAQFSVSIIASFLIITVIVVPNVDSNPVSSPQYSSYPQYTHAQRTAAQRAPQPRRELIDEDTLDLDYFLIVSDAYKTIIKKIKTSIDNSKKEIKIKIDTFPEKIISNITTFTEVVDKYNSSTTTKNCTGQNCTIEACFNLIPDKNDYAKSFGVFANLLILEFEKNELTLEKQLLMLENTMSVTHELISVKRAKALLKKSAVNEMKQWENETVDKLYDMFHRLWLSTISLVDDLTALSKREEELEQTMCLDKALCDDVSTVAPNVKEIIVKNSIAEIIDNYEENFTSIRTDLMEIKNNLEANRLYVESALKTFKNNLLNEDIFKNSYDEYQCRNYGTRCSSNTQCSVHILNKGKFNESIDVFSRLLLADFNEKLLKFDHQLNNLLTDVLTSKMLIYIESKLNDTNEQYLNNTDNWKKDIIDSLKVTKENTLNMAKDLIIAFKTLNENEQKFERYILEKFSEKKLKYACCLKSFDFDIEIEGLRCNPPPAQDDQISISQDDLIKFSLLHRKQS